MAEYVKHEALLNKQIVLKNDHYQKTIIPDFKYSHKNKHYSEFINYLSLSLAKENLFRNFTVDNKNGKYLKLLLG